MQEFTAVQFYSPRNRRGLCDAGEPQQFLPVFYNYLYFVSVLTFLWQIYRKEDGERGEEEAKRREDDV